MHKAAIIYLHGFNSASWDLNGNLLISKQKLAVLQDFCTQNGVLFFSPNVDYRDFSSLVEDCLFEWNQLLDQDYRVLFMGSSMGGFASEYLAMKTGGKALMINPAISPTALLPQFIGVEANYETGQPYSWDQNHCLQYRQYEVELAVCNQAVERTILLDMADELIDSNQTIAEYRNKADIVSFAGGSHSFEHMAEALPVLEKLLFD